MSVVGIDVGTTAVKALLLDEEARVVAEASHPHDLKSPRPGWAEEDPADWWKGVQAALGALAGQAPLADVGMAAVSGMVPALVLLDEAGRVLRPSIQQNDARHTEEIAWFRERFPEDWLFGHAGATWNQQVIPPKLLWIQRHEPEAFARIRRIAGSYEYVTGRLGGPEYLEANWALESGLWSERERRWLVELLDALELDPGVLRPVRFPGEVVGEVASSEVPLPLGTPLAAGSADHIAAALAAGLLAEGEAVLKFGGAGDFLYVSSAFAPLKELFIDHHDVPGRYVINGCMATSGSLVKWFRDRFAPGTTYAELDTEAERVPAGSEGVVLLPYFLGEKTPIHDPKARGTVLGLTLSHGPAHLYRAILEGVAYAFRHHVEVLEAHGHAIERFYVMDGGARSPLWRKITASVLGRPVVHLASGHAGSAFGTAFLAGVNAGFWSFERIKALATPAGTTEPDPAWARVYDALYGVYRETYERLKVLYPRLEVHDA
ncbi:FGGY-family carbohydrate kinase [Oceanithermus desulfurans]|uniref:Carbohydrate kinase n=2 Tax=Oceanithermus desulfurans TaxID=227924 RepID=A0A511RM75_9DEIN|nr:FGGY family carbohydrate kinase [Oceanithermus desulfurans]MBB6030548.1 xylulokinase [Oceanithermus desulfurans]GEM90042.1 carbohydrate kinase [Oceanithermus desulfurans NBRC 100063]